MNGRDPWRYLPPIGPVFSFTLIGIVLLSALLYYRAIKIQRYLEPVLALSQPRNEFSKVINKTFEKEFGAASTKGLEIQASSLVMHKSRLFFEDGALKPLARADLRKFAHMFLSLMENAHAKSHIGLVLIISRFPSHGAEGGDVYERAKSQRMVGFMQDALFRAEPELGRKYSSFFAATVQPTTPHEQNLDVIELRIIPSELLHIEVVQKLEKYAF